MHYTQEPLLSTKNSDQRTGCNDGPSYMYTKETRTLPAEFQSPLPRICIPHPSTVATPQASALAAFRTRWVSSRSPALHCARNNLGASQDVREQLVRRKSSVNLPGDAIRALAPDVDEEHEHRGFGNGHGMVLDRENLHLRQI